MNLVGSWTGMFEMEYNIDGMYDTVCTLRDEEFGNT